MKKHTRFDDNIIEIKKKYAIIYLDDRKGNYIGKIVIDIESIPLVKEFKWHKHKHRNTTYAKTKLKPKQQLLYKRKSMKIHQLIMACPKGLMVDHKNHNGLDNRIKNLRVVTNRINSENKITNTSGYPGISWHSGDRKWRARTQIEGKNYFIGNFNCKKKAFKKLQRFKKQKGIL